MRETLETAKTCERVDNSHTAVFDFYKTRNDKMEECVNIIRGRLYTPEEIKIHKEMRREPISLNKALAPFRAVMGTVMQGSYSANFLPFEDSDQPLAEILQKLAIFENNKNKDELQNAQMYQNAYITGRAYRFCTVIQGEGIDTRIESEVLNPFAVYFDPTSTEVITRSDAQFVDVVKWLSAAEIIQKFPHAESQITESDKEDYNQKDFYEYYDKSADRRHETTYVSNGKFKVIERYYRVDNNGKEQLNLAVWAPELLNDKSFLFNGAYHVQATDPDTGKIMFPVVELVSDNIMGESDGFIEFLKDPIKLASRLYTLLLESAKHSGTGYLVNREAFATPEEADRFIKFGANANQRYAIKGDKSHEGIVIPIKGIDTPAIDLQAIAHTDKYIDENSSSTKAMQGISESSSTPAALNAQRIEQAGIQLNIFTSHIKQYAEQLLRLRFGYWRKSYTEEMKFRITMPNSETGRQETITLNQWQPVIGWGGQPTGEIEKVNDISVAKFDIIISESQQTPTQRELAFNRIMKMLEIPAFAQNPVIAPALAESAFDASQIDYATKTKVRQQLQQQQMAPQMPLQQTEVA